MAEEIIGNYRLLAEIGRGGMGIIYKAEQMGLGRIIALKVLYPHLVADPITVKRFTNEARATALLNHPNIVQVHDVGVDGDRYFFAMEYVPGATLGSVIESKGRLSAEETLRIADQVASALTAAHDVGIIHRDIKPSNILIDGHGRAKVADFGIALAAGQGDLTDEGHIVGTARYMSPEQARGEDLDGRSDIYSLGVVMYEMLTGVVPFSDEDSPLAVLQKHLTEPVPPMEGIPPMTEALVRKCLEKCPEKRWPTAGEFRKSLREAAAELEWRGPALPTMDPTVEGLAPAPAFCYDHAGALRSAIDAITLSLAGMPHRREGLRSRIGRRLLAGLARRLERRQDSCKLKHVEVLDLKERLASAETRLEEARRDCDSAYAKYESAQAELREWQMRGSLLAGDGNQVPEEVAASREEKLMQLTALCKLEWQDLQDRVKDLYAEIDGMRRVHDIAVKELEMLRWRRKQLAAETGVTRRNCVNVISVCFLVLTSGAGTISWLVFHRAMSETKVPLVYGKFQVTGAMCVPRGEHATALLDDGNVLVAGGVDGDNNALASAEIFHCASGNWTPTGKLCRARFNHTMTTLAEGQGVIVVGGSQEREGPDATDSVEKFTNNRFEEVGRVRVARTRHQSVLLSDGRVLVTGGSDDQGRSLDSAEIFTPSTNEFRLLKAKMVTGRSDHKATVLPGGRVMITGGRHGDTPLKSVEVFDPITEQFENACPLINARYEHTATAIDPNRCLIIGGRRRQTPAEIVGSIELIDIEKRTSTVVGNLLGPRAAHTTVLLPGTPMLLIVGGDVGEGGDRGMCEFYSLGWIDGRPAGRLSQNRSNHTATVLSDGTVLFSGGYDQDTGHPLPSAELYVKIPASAKPILLPSSTDNPPADGKS